MPTYDYHCATCGGFEALRSIAARNDVLACPDCGIAAPRVLASAPRLALMEDTTRRAMDINERARHEPKRSGELARRHPGGCSCCWGGAGGKTGNSTGNSTGNGTGNGTENGQRGKRSSTLTAPNGNKAFPSKRPWMISH